MKGKKHNGSHHGEHAAHRDERMSRARGGVADDDQGKSDKDTGWEADDAAPTDAYEGKGSNVEKEADSEKAKMAGKKRRCGGKVEGEKGKKRLDRKPRARGGAAVAKPRAGAEKSPLSTAAKLTMRPGGKMDSEED
jgi:hypothetical protein